MPIHDADDRASAEATGYRTTSCFMLQLKQIITVVRLVTVLLNPLELSLETQQKQNINTVIGL